MVKETEDRSAPFGEVLNAAKDQFVSAGTVDLETAEEIAHHVMRKANVQNLGYKVVEEALRVHYGSSQETSSSRKDEKIKEKFETYIRGLHKKRHIVATEHEEYLKQYPPKEIGPHGSTEVYGLYNKIEAALELAKEMGIIPQEAHIDDYRYHPEEELEEN